MRGGRTDFGRHEHPGQAEPGLAAWVRQRMLRHELDRPSGGRGGRLDDVRRTYGQAKKNAAGDASRAPGGAGLSGGHDRPGDPGQMLLGRPAGGAGGGGMVRDIVRVKT